MVESEPSMLCRCGNESKSLGKSHIVIPASSSKAGRPLISNHNRGRRPAKGEFINNLYREVSVSMRTLAFRIGFVLMVPLAFLGVGILGLFEGFDVSSNSFPFWGFIAIGMLVLVVLGPFALTLKRVRLDGDQMIVTSLLFDSQTISVHELYSVDIACTTPVTVTIKLFDGSRVSYMPRKDGLFDVTEPTRCLVAHAETNRTSRKLKKTTRPNGRQSA